jgi:hypothetical protein
MEQVMATLTPGQIFLVCIGALLAMAGFVNTVGAAYDRIKNARQAAQAPNKAQDDQLAELKAWKKEMEAANLPARVKSLEDWKPEAERKLAADKRELVEIHNGMRASHLAQLALLDHALNGNNIQQMQEAKGELQKYLANK